MCARQRARACPHFDSLQTDNDFVRCEHDFGLYLFAYRTLWCVTVYHMFRLTPLAIHTMKSTTFLLAVLVLVSTAQVITSKNVMTESQISSLL